jgi:hypothetical protein
MTDLDVARAKTLVGFLGLTSVVGPSDQRALSFRLGVLYPYSADLRRVYDSYVEVITAAPDAEPLLVGDPPRVALDVPVGPLADYVAALAMLHDRTAFASPVTDASVEHAHASVRGAVARATQAAAVGARA